MPAPRYRKVSCKMYSDAKFKALSKPQPNGQTLWTYLITGPYSTNIPGVVIGGPAAISESLKWPVEAFSKAFGEALREGLAKASFEDCLIYLNNGIKHNPPESPNVVKSWATTWDDIPECDLKLVIYNELKAFVEAYGEAFAKAFAKAISKPSLKAIL